MKEGIQRRKECEQKGICRKKEGIESRKVYDHKRIWKNEEL